jgi:CspA family cold shock protein
MGRYRDHRDLRRHRQDGEFPSASDSSDEPRYFQHLDGAVAHSVDAEVIWFNADKGFGFVKVADGTEAYLHARTLEAVGSGGISAGTHLKVTLERGEKGRQVSQVMEVRNLVPKSVTDKRPTRGTLHSDPGIREEHEGVVKWYNSDKGFGFITPTGGGEDIFVHATAVARSGLIALTERQKVLVICGQGPKGLEVRTIRVE